jgi:hypothetical protein
MEYFSAHMTCLGQVKNGLDNIVYRRLFHSRLQRRVVGIIGVHCCIDSAGGYGIKTDAIFCILDSATSRFVDRSPQQLAGEPVIDTELSRTRADQPDKEENVQNFRKVEEVIEPAKKRKPFRHSGKRAGQGGDSHIDQ